MASTSGAGAQKASGLDAQHLLVNLARGNGAKSPEAADAGRSAVSSSRVKPKRFAGSTRILQFVCTRSATRD